MLFEVFLLSVLFDKTTSSMTIGKQCWAVTRWRRRVSESTPEEVAVTRRHRSAKFAEVNFPSLRFGRRRRSFSGRLASFASDFSIILKGFKQLASSPPNHQHQQPARLTVSGSSFSRTQSLPSSLTHLACACNSFL